MATFYGQVKGNASSTATRQGSAASGIRSSVQSWNGSLIMDLSYDENDALYIEVMHSTGSEFRGYTIFRGTVDEFVDMCKKHESLDG